MILKKKYNKNRVSQLTNSFLTRFSFMIMIVIRCDNIKISNFIPLNGISVYISHSSLQTEDCARILIH